MRVAIVVRSLKIGGMERVAISLAEAFADNQHEAHLIYFKNKKNTLAPNESVKVHRFNLDKLMLQSIIGIVWEIFFRIFNMFLRKSYPLFKGFFTSQIFKFKFSKLEKEYGKFDLIIVRGQGTLELIYHNRDNRIVFVSEGIFSYGTMNKYIKSFQIKSLYEHRNIVGVSSGVIENLRVLKRDENFQSKTLLKITNPINVKNTNTLADAYTPDFNEPFILSVGRIIPGKNIPLLLSAYHQALVNYDIKHKLVIVGDGSDMPLVKRKVKELRLESHVHFTGQLTNPFPWMKKADLFILSSKFEGLGMVLLEAIACGTKVIATKSRGGVTDIMKGVLSPYLAEQNAQDLSKKINTALQEEKNLDFDEILKEFAPKTIVNQYIKNFT
ncbi:MAG: glycosyltransferase [Sulfurimonas sp.]|nr:glycosyltransferase [Sulfurimonas sp.]